MMDQMTMGQDMAIEKLMTFSMASPLVTLHQPLGDFVSIAIAATCHSNDSRRAYTEAIGLFVDFLDRQYGNQLPEECNEWRPLAFCDRSAKRKRWTFRGPAVILRIVSQSSLDLFAEERIALGNSINTVNFRESAIRSFLKVALRDGILSQEQASSLAITAYRKRGRSVKNSVGRRLSIAEVRLLRDSVNTTTTKGKRDLAIIDLMLYLGLRRSEVVSLKTSSFLKDRGKWYVSILGKGNKQRKLKLPAGLMASLSQWEREAGFQLGRDDNVFFGWVSMKRRGQAITGNTINTIVRQYGFKADIATLTGKGCLSPHDLRRTAARNAYEQGASLIQVQTMLGHSSLVTTQLYIGEPDEDDTAMDLIQY